MNIKFAENLKTLRKQEKLSQTALADKLHTTQRKVSHWESGKIEPDLSSLWTIADFFDVTVDFLIGRNICKNLFFFRYSPTVSDEQNKSKTVRTVNMILLFTYRLSATFRQYRLPKLEIC